MSDEKREFYHHDSFLRDRPFDDDLSSIFRHRSGAVDSNQQDPLSVEPLSARYMSFTDYLHGPSDYNSLMRAFDVPCASSDHELLFQTNHGGGSNMTAPSVGNENPVTPNSSISSSSAEVVAEEDSGRCKNDLQKKDKVRKQQQQQQQQQPKEGEDGGDKSKKVSKPRKQGEKRQKVPRFAFMTKSEVDHLEDGYRWRKYGQKAVKNSPYPRGYYRCTTQKCPVKKRVERSKEDPTVVITTYEGQHTHHSPATIRSGSHVLAPPPANSSSFHHDLLMLNQLSNNGRQGDTDSRMYLQSRASTPHQHLQLPDYGLLQDVIPSFIN